MTREEKTLELSRDMEEIEEIINCDADAKIKLKMISNIVYSKPHYFKTLEQEPCEDAISRQAVLDYFFRPYSNEESYSNIDIARIIKALPSVKPQEPYDFAKWVASEIFDDMWEYNKDAFAEIACRKLAKLGIVRAKGDEWELIESEG